MEFLSWIADNLQDEGRYVIIDDEYVRQDSQLPHFILTNPYDGITTDLVNKAIKILNGLKELSFSISITVIYGIKI